MIRLVNKDGSMVVSSQDVSQAFLTACASDKIKVDDISDDIQQYNDLCDRFFKSEYKIEVGNYYPASNKDHESRSEEWNTPAKYKAIDVREYVLALCQTPLEVDRVEYEMALFEERQLLPLLQLMIYIVDEFRRHNLVWGVGRGSSCASYTLFLIGIHKIDSLKYELDIHEFLK